MKWKYGFARLDPSVLIKTKKIIYLFEINEIIICCKSPGKIKFSGLFRWNLVMYVKY